MCMVNQKCGSKRRISIRSFIRPRWIRIVPFENTSVMVYGPFLGPSNLQ